MPVFKRLFWEHQLFIPICKKLTLTNNFLRYWKGKEKAKLLAVYVLIAQS
jgi:hypothetical protein